VIATVPAPDPAAVAGTDSLPTVTVVIPTRNRARWLPYTFAALAPQLYPAALVEVVVVDNSSTDDTERVVREWAAALPFPVHFHRKANEGPAASRNFGAARATGSILAFTDSDCMPEPGWLRNGVRAIEGGRGLVTGPIFPRRTAGTHFMLNAQMGAVLRDDGLYRTASMIVSRRIFDEVGGFDESFTLGWGGALLGGEDTDLGWRIKRGAGGAEFRPDVAMVHLATPISLGAWLLRPVLSQTLPRLLRANPELRRTTLWLRYFHKPTDFFILLGLAGVAGAIGFRFWALLLLPLAFVWPVRRSLMGMLRKARVDKAAAILVLLAAQSLLNVAVLAAASVRYRRLVL